MHSNAEAGGGRVACHCWGSMEESDSFGRRWIGGGNGNGNPIIQLRVSGEEDGCVT